MKTVVKILYILLSVLILYYLWLPNQVFPSQLSDSLQSREPADTEDINRRAYFTDFDRDQTINQYKTNFNLQNSPFQFYPLRLNYPPEEAQLIIRDQTRSSYLEEVVYPMRESVYINGFKAQNSSETILIENKVWLQKITVKFVSSNRATRLIVGLVSLFLFPIIVGSYVSLFKELITDLVKIKKMIWIS